MNFTYLIIGFLALLGLLFGVLKFWFWTQNHKELSELKRVVKELTDKKTPKLTKEDQIRFIDGKIDLTIIEDILGEKEISQFALEYFIDIQPDEYFEHLKKHNPPTTWTEDIYTKVKIKHESEKYEIIYYDHGKESLTKSFDEYDKLLKYLVYTRLTRIGFKYKKLINEEFFI
jgi:hypothetical protein